MSAGRLLLVPTPLDFSLEASASIDELLPLRSLRAAVSLRHWVVENAKTARAVLKRIDAVQPLGVPLQALNIQELPRPSKGASITKAPSGDDALRALLQPLRDGHDLGLMSEAGLPGVADPGAALVALAHREGLRVLSLPGSSSLTQALAASGLNGQSFAFQGYLPQDAAERRARITELELLSRRQAQTQLVIETPYRNEVLLAALLQALQPTTRLAVSLALTTAQESTRCDTVARWRSQPSPMPKDQPAMFSWLAS